MGRACSTGGEKRNAYRILLGRPERKRPVGRLDISGRIINIVACRSIARQ
jgi:hypothetical protein